MGRGRWLAVIAGALAIAGAAWWWGAARGPLVEAGNPQRGTAVDAIYATGVVEPERWAKVTPQVRGQITSLCACEGEAVTVDQELARLDDREARARLTELEARERFLAAEVTRYRDLLRKRVVSEQAFERIASERAQASAAAAAAQQRLAHYTLRAPIGGVVLRRDGEVGEIVESGQILFWVGQPTPLWIIAEVDEEDITAVRPGQAVLIKSDAFPRQVLPGTVKEITPKGDPIAKNFRVRIALPAETPLLIGMTTEINIIVREVDRALLVPREAVIDGTVWVLQGGKARRRQVRIGVIGRDRVEILSGLTETETVLLDPPEGLREGARARPMAPQTGQ